MAWQLHYTSARRGPTGRAGFQFVAETPGLPDGTRAAVTPYLSYRPPPDAPPEPGDGELERFPVTLLYDRVAMHERVRPLLLRCRYLGRDYSGRYGNFFAHAVVAEPDELEGLRPAELWRAALWSDQPSPGTDLPELEDLTPDAALAPDALAGWLAGLPDGYSLLAHLVDAVTGVLGRGHGRVVLVSGDIEQVARWIAVLSYSLPVAAAARMSFVTYSADPDGAAQRVVGTTPDVWATAHRAGAHAFALDETPSAGAGAASRFARTVAGCWREADFAGLDALGELALLDTVPDQTGPDPAALDRAAALLALCRGETTVTMAEEAGAARLLARHGVTIPDWVWRDLVPGVPAMGFDLAVAVHGRARDAGAPDVAAQCALRATVLAVADAEVRPLLARHAHLLTDLPPEARARLAAETSAALKAAPPLTAIAQITAVAARVGMTPDPGEVTTAAMAHVQARKTPLDEDLATALTTCPSETSDALLEGVLRALAAADATTRTTLLTDTTCDLLAHPLLTTPPPPGNSGAAPDGEGALSAFPEVALPVLASVGRRRREQRVAVTGALLALPVSPADLDPALGGVWAVPPDAAECLRLLDAHADRFAEHPALAALPSRTFGRLRAGALSKPSTLRLAARVQALLPDDPAARDAAVVRAHSDALAADEPEHVARALATICASAAHLAEEALDSVAARLVRRAPAFRAAVLAAASAPVRARLGACWTSGLPDRPHRADHAPRHELIEVVLRLRRRGVTEPGLDAWARAAASRRFAARRLEAHLSGEPGLLAALRELLDQDPGR
ncbi:GAP1-N2 domain-containing protein [Actinomadura hibisca]|uniref:GAP1-N2 domain-containing protein n=1 Tax=Actinomadura hibisca TaxID=68565 RepID=UPI00083788AE|nr:hypothetical protein [Actinomadura hibisca]